MPLTLSTWQYELLMRWVDEVRQQALAAPAGPVLNEALFEVRTLSPAAASRRAAVLSRIDAAELR
jgi:hypothetical protein